MFELKPLHKDAISAALDKAMRYRLLNEPGAAQSKPGAPACNAVSKAPNNILQVLSLNTNCVNSDFHVPGRAVLC